MVDVWDCIECDPNEGYDYCEADDPALEGGDLAHAEVGVVVNEGQIVIFGEFIEDLTHRHTRLQHQEAHLVVGWIRDGLRSDLRT